MTFPVGCPCCGRAVLMTQRQGEFVLVRHAVREDAPAVLCEGSLLTVQDACEIREARRERATA